MNRLICNSRLPICALFVSAALLGHSDISITYDRYITVYRDRDAEAAEAFGKIVT